MISDGHEAVRRARPGMKLALVLATLFVAGLTIGVLVSSPWSRAAPGGVAPVSEPDAAQSTRPAADALPAAETGQSGASEARRTPTVVAARRVGPSVVSVIVRRTLRPSFFDDFFNRRPRSAPGLGSGFAIDLDGHILTNNHVVAGADTILVMDRHGLLYPATVVGADELTDIALLRIEPGRIEPAPLGTSSDLMVGEPAIAIGNPSGFSLKSTESIVTSGVISGLGRDIISRNREVLYANMIQTDAAINPGNSGGPLVNADGEVIGVNSAIFSQSGGSEGLGFAIPIDRAVRVADQLRELGHIRRPWVGIDVAEAQSDSLIRIPVVSRVAPGSPGERAGLREDDVILSIDGRAVSSRLDWDVALLEIGPEETVEVEYRRGGRVRTASLQIEEIPSERAERVEVLAGLRLVTVTDQIAQERRLRVESGALVVEVTREISSMTGLRPGDVIISINQRPARDAGEAAELFEFFAGGQGWVRIGFVRGDRRWSSTFRIGRG